MTGVDVKRWVRSEGEGIIMKGGGWYQRVVVGLGESAI